jgi:hypothetical protein
MTWQDPATNTWWQVFDDGDGPDFRNPSPEMLRPDVHLRGAVDRDAQQAMAKRRKGARKPRPSLYQKRLKQRMDGYAAVMKAQAVWWQRQIDRVSKPASRRKAR